VRIGGLDLDGVPVISGDDIRLVPIVAVRGKVYGIRGRGLVRSDIGKTSSALRIIPLPGFVTDRLRARLTGEEDPSIGSCPSAPPVRASKLATQAMEVASVTVGAAGHGGGAPLWFPTDAVSR
jgi:hypothetical protein